MSPNITCSISLKSYNPYILKKFQKIKKFIAFTAACPKMQIAVLALLVLSGLKCFTKIY
jgi:hypothetical protein